MLIGHFPAGSVKTPLSVLGLKHKPHPDPVEEVDGEITSRFYLANF